MMEKVNCFRIGQTPLALARQTSLPSTSFDTCKWQAPKRTLMQAQ